MSRRQSLFPEPPDSPGFTRFWNTYPRPVGKPSARKAYILALRKAMDDEIYDGLLIYPFNPENHLQPHPATWLNDERWKIEAPRPPPTVIVNGKPSSVDTMRAMVGTLLDGSSQGVEQSDEGEDS